MAPCSASPSPASNLPSASVANDAPRTHAFSSDDERDKEFRLGGFGRDRACGRTSERVPMALRCVAMNERGTATRVFSPRPDHRGYPLWPDHPLYRMFSHPLDAFLASCKIFSAIESFHGIFFSRGCAPHPAELCSCCDFAGIPYLPLHDRACEAPCDTLPPPRRWEQSYPSQRNTTT